MIELPGSETVPTSIWLSVTPWAVAPLAEPGPHTPTRSPKLPAATGAVPGSGATVDSVGAAAVVGAACSPEPPQAAPATAEINSTQMARRAVLMALSQGSGVGPRNAIARGPARPDTRSGGVSSNPTVLEQHPGERAVCVSGPPEEHLLGLREHDRRIDNGCRPTSVGCDVETAP